MEESTEDRILRERVTAEVKRQVHDVMIPIEALVKEKTVLNVGMLNSEVARQMKPLVTEVKKLTDLVSQYDMVLESLQESLQDELVIDLFSKTLAESSLYSRVKVYLEMEYLNSVLQGDDCRDDGVMNAAEEWSKKATLHIVRTVNTWMQDGAPMVHRTIPVTAKGDLEELNEGGTSSD